MMKRLTLLFTVAFLIFQVLPSCQKAPPPPEPIRIGAMAYDIPGDDTTEGKLTLRGAEMAVERANSAGGVLVNNVTHKVELIFAGYEDSPENAVLTAKKLINQERVIALVGPQASRNAIPVGEIAEQSRIPMISPLSTNPKTTLNRRYVFRMSFLDGFQGRAVSEFARKNLGLFRGAVLYDATNPYSREIALEFKNDFEKEGGQVAFYEAFIPDKESEVETFREIQESSPQFLFLPNSSKYVKQQVTTARLVGIDVPLIGSDSWDRKTFSTLEPFQGTYMAAHWHPHERNEETVQFASEYKDRYGTPPTDTPSLTYDAVNLILEAIQFADSTAPQAICNALYEMGPYDAITGPIDFVDNGNPVKGVVFLRFRNGQIEYIDQILPLE